MSVAVFAARRPVSPARLRERIDQLRLDSFGAADEAFDLEAKLEHPPERTCPVCWREMPPSRSDD